MKRKDLFLVFTCLCLLSFAVRAGGPALTPEERDLEAIRELFAELKWAYATEDIDLFLRCHERNVTSIDVTRNLYEIYTEERTRRELAEVFAALDNITVDFLNMEIEIAEERALVKTLRRGVASGFPAVIYVDMIYTLTKDGRGRSGHGWQIDGYTLLAERYDFEEYVDPGPAGAWGTEGAKYGRKRGKPAF
ncbi:MAG: hypothetical protein ACUVRM_07900 [Bacillota bacterium]